MDIRHELLQLIARELAGVPASDIKNRRPLDYPISREMSSRIDVYLGRRTRPAQCD
jgi:hypothetical protein